MRMTIPQLTQDTWWLISYVFLHTLQTTARQCIQPGIHHRDLPGFRMSVMNNNVVTFVNIADIVKFHKQHGKMATLTSVKMVQEKGVLDIDE